MKDQLDNLESFNLTAKERSKARQLSLRKRDGSYRAHDIKRVQVRAYEEEQLVTRLRFCAANRGSEAALKDRAYAEQFF